MINLMNSNEWIIRCQCKSVQNVLICKGFTKQYMNYHFKHLARIHLAIRTELLQLKQFIIINSLQLFPERRLQYCWSKSADLPSTNPVVRSKSYNIPMLTPVAEYDSEVSSVGSVGIRRHSACDVTSCIEHQGYSALSVGIETSSTPRLSLDHDLMMRGATGQPSLISPPVFIHTSTGCLHAPDAQIASSESEKVVSSPPSCSSSPETIVMQGLDSLESDPEGIFIDFSHCRSDSFGTSRKTSWLQRIHDYDLPLFSVNL